MVSLQVNHAATVCLINCVAGSYGPRSGQKFLRVSGRVRKAHPNSLVAPFTEAVLARRSAMPTPRIASPLIKQSSSLRLGRLGKAKLPRVAILGHAKNECEHILRAMVGKGKRCRTNGLFGGLHPPYIFILTKPQAASCLFRGRQGLQVNIRAATPADSLFNCHCEERFLRRSNLELLGRRKTRLLRRFAPRNDRVNARVS